MKRTIEVIVLAILLSLLTIPVFGQTQTGTIVGTVRDTTGAAVAGAAVAARNLSTSATRTVTTAADGAYKRRFGQFALRLTF
jgi:hypothetical protein